MTRWPSSSNMCSTHSMKLVACRTCGATVRVRDRARLNEFYCSDRCSPRCAHDACENPAGGLSEWCWVHRPKHRT